MPRLPIAPPSLTCLLGTIVNGSRAPPRSIERGGARLPLTIVPSKQVKEGGAIGRRGILPDYGNVPVIVAGVEPDMPASEAGLKQGDQFLTVGGEKVDSAEQVRQYIR